MRAAFSPSLLDSVRRHPVVQQMRDVDLVFTVTSGRSGTKLLTSLCQRSAKVSADHEPEPRANFALRPALVDPDSAVRWFVDEKLPAWARHRGQTHVETSHLYCKGLLEPLIALGVRPRLIALRRAPEQVAASLFQMDVVPARTAAGDLVLLRPDDAGVLPCPGWEQLSDYALCYWYALEIERRQALYLGWARSQRVRTARIDMPDLLTFRSWLRVAAFLNAGALKNAVTGRATFKEITSANQNPRSQARPESADRPLPNHEERLHDHGEVLRRTTAHFPADML